MKKNNTAAEKYAERFTTEARKILAELSFREGQKFQLEDDIECAKLFVKRFCIKYRLPDPDEIVAQFEKEMRDI